MAKKEKETSIETWKKRIQEATKRRDKERDTHGWERFLDMYEGRYQFPNSQAHNKIPIINLVYGYVHTEIPKLYMRDPYITANAKGKDYIQRAKVLETTLNYDSNHVGFKYEIDKVLMDSLLVGHGWVKLGYSGDFDRLDVKGVDHEKNEKISDQISTIKSEEIFILHVPWYEILIDPLAKDAPNDSTWIIHSFVRPLDYVKNSGLYENTADLKANVSLKTDEKKQGSSATYADDVPLVQLHEIWDQKSGKILTMSEDHDKFLRNIDNEYEMEGLPFEKLYFNRSPKKGSQYPLSDIEIIEPQILERIKLRASMLNHVKRWNRQASIEKGAMSTQEVQKYEMGLDGALLERMPGKEAPKPLEYAAFQPEAFVLDRLIGSDQASVIGVTETEQGGQSKTETKTLGELNAQMAGSVNRTQKRIDIVEDFIERVANKMVALMKQFYDTPRYVQITDSTPEEILQSFGPKVASTYDGTGIKFSKEDIQGEFDIEVKAGSTLPMNKQNRIKIIEMILGMLPKLPTTPIGIELFKELLRELDMKAAEKVLDEQLVDIAKAQAPALPPGGSPSPPGGLPQLPLQPNNPLLPQ